MKLRKLKSVEMATNHDIYSMEFLPIKFVSVDDHFEIWIDGVLIDDSDESLKEAHDNARANYLIDEQMIVRGYGTLSGRKIWQLPEKLKNEILARCEI